jgi:hypothetical protein
MRAYLGFPAMGLILACSGGEESRGARLAAAGAATAGLPPVDACTILTREEIEAAAGWKIDSSGPGAAAFQGSSCNFYGQTLDDLVGVGIASQGLTGINTSAELARFFSDTAEQGMFAVDAKPVEGLGVPASTFTLGWTVLTALGKGHRRVDVTSPAETVSRTLIIKVLARLP